MTLKLSLKFFLHAIPFSSSTSAILQGQYPVNFIIIIENPMIIIRATSTALKYPNFNTHLLDLYSEL
jgi:hypothetical protein